MYKVDKADEELVAKYNWSKSSGYIKAFIEKSRLDPTYTGKRERTVVYMHRLVIGAKEGEIVDHINQDKTDNRKSNLRIATKSVNTLNSKWSISRTGFRGVMLNKQKGKPYKATITIDGKRTHLGSFDDPEEAHKAYCIKRKEHINGLYA